MSERPVFNERLESLFRRHPVVFDTLRWAIPALLFGAFVRITLTAYFPYALWGADSRSFYVFAHKFILNGSFSLGDKRRYLYPLLMLPISYLPGGPLRWLPFFQHTFGLATLIPLAYVVRKSLNLWRLWIIPITVAYAGLPIVIWCEHELLGDTVFFALLIWSFAGWTAWVTQATLERAHRMFWVFLVPFALFILTKPHGRFTWPGLLIGLCLVKAWQRLSRSEIIALLGVMIVTPAVGSKKQGAWLLYDATYPLTCLDTPLHADYKAEIREDVQHYRNDLEIYHAFQDKEPFYFLRDPGEQDKCPLWKALGQDDKLKNKLYLDLAIEALMAHPGLFLYMGLQRVILDSDVSSFGEYHFADGNFIEHTKEYYDEAEKDERSPIRLAFALPRKGPIPPYSEFQHQLEPAPGSWPARSLRACVGLYGTRLDFFRYTGPGNAPRRLSFVRPTFLAFWLGAGCVLSLLPRYRKTLGVWMIVALGYVYMVYLVSLVNIHYFAPIWPVLFVLIAVPADAVLSKLAARSGDSQKLKV